jgi:PhoPQ-activated pathogenicity-related protein
MWESYGGWSFALQDYLDMHNMDYLNNPVFKQIMSIVGPDAYYDRLIMPKYAICSTGDEFFMPDGITYMWDDLKGGKLLRMVPNAEHSLIGHQLDIMSSVQSWVLGIVQQHQIPAYSWALSADGSTMTVTLQPSANGSVMKPLKALLWEATNPRKRDFRLIVCGDTKNVSCLNPILWKNSELNPTGENTYVVTVKAPNQGWSGFFVELQYNIGGFSALDPMKVSTAVSVVPKTRPFPPCGPKCDVPAPSPPPPMI